MTGGSFDVDDPSDMLVTISAEDSFDVESHLIDVKAPTLVLGGAADHFYSEDLFRRTAAGIPNGRAVIFPGKGSHLGGQLQDVDVHRSWLPDWRSSVTTLGTRLMTLALRASVCHLGWPQIHSDESRT